MKKFKLVLLSLLVCFSLNAQNNDSSSEKDSVLHGQISETEMRTGNADAGVLLLPLPARQKVQLEVIAYGKKSWSFAPTSYSTAKYQVSKSSLYYSAMNNSYNHTQTVPARYRFIYDLTDAVVSNLISLLSDNLSRNIYK